MRNLIFICAALLACPLNAARYPQLLRLQGRFTDTRIPLTDTLPVRFTIWDSADGYGNLLWEDVQSVAIQDSTFQVVLGRNKAITPSVFSGGDRWVEIQLGNDAPMRPRHWIPNKALQAQVAALPPVPASVSPPPPVMTEQEKRELELQIEKYKEPVIQEKAPAPAPAVKPKPAPKRTAAVQSVDSSGIQGPVYEVQSGDTLKSIAQKLYGNAELWYDLYYLNRDRLGPMGHLFTGQILVLPVKTPGEQAR